MMRLKRFENFSGNDVLADIEDVVLHLGENLGVYYKMIYNVNLKVLVFKLDGDSSDIKLEVKGYHSQMRVSKLMLEDLGFNLFADGDLLVITVFKDLVTAGIEFLDYFKGIMRVASGESGRNLVSLYKDLDGRVLVKTVIGFSVDRSFGYNGGKESYSYTQNCNFTMNSILEFFFGGIFYDSDKRSKLDRIVLTWLKDIDAAKYGGLSTVSIGIHTGL